jgi:hypothetical protein
METPLKVDVDSRAWLKQKPFLRGKYEFKIRENSAT